MEEKTEREKAKDLLIELDKQDVAECERLIGEALNKTGCGVVIYHTTGSDGTNNYEFIITKK